MYDYFDDAGSTGRVHFNLCTVYTGTPDPGNVLSLCVPVYTVE